LCVITAHTYSPLPPESEECNQEQALCLAKGRFNASIFRNDADFDLLYPEHFQLMSQNHWTPLKVAQKAASFLNVKGKKVLDIGSGIGKFCLIAGKLNPESSFFGIEQRNELVHCADDAKDYLGLENVHFIHANMTQVNFREFDHFYFYNSFYENIDQHNAIDNNIETSFSLFTYYTLYLRTVLNQMPSGTRVVTYQSEGEVIPSTYKIAEHSFNTLLRLWIRE
jgi:SAM-dependent methyltransferase